MAADSQPNSPQIGCTEAGPEPSASKGSKLDDLPQMLPELPPCRGRFPKDQFRGKLLMLVPRVVTMEVSAQHASP